MTRENLVEIIRASSYCPNNPCGLPEQEGNTGECCRKCAENELDKFLLQTLGENTAKLLKARKTSYTYMIDRGERILKSPTVDNDDMAMGIQLMIGIAKSEIEIIDRMLRPAPQKEEVLATLRELLNDNGVCDPYDPTWFAISEAIKAVEKNE